MPIRLRPFVLADAPRLFSMSLEDGMRRWIPDQVYPDLAYAEKVTGMLAGWTARFAPAEQPYVVGVEVDGELVGHVGLSPKRGSVEIGYAIGEAWQGRGHATAAVTAACADAFARGTPEVLGFVEHGNHGSVRVLEKAGFQRTGDEERHVVLALKAPPRTATIPG